MNLFSFSEEAPFAERNRIIAALRDSGSAMSPREIADATLMGYGNVRQFLFQMVKAGEVEKQSRGRYTLIANNATNTINASGLTR